MIGLSEPLNDGVTGLFVEEGLSLWKDTMESRRSQPVEGRREWGRECESVASFSGIRKGGLVRVCPRRRRLAAPNDREALRKSVSWD